MSNTQSIHFYNKKIWEKKLNILSLAFSFHTLHIFGTSFREEKLPRAGALLLLETVCEAGEADGATDPPLVGQARVNQLQAKKKKNPPAPQLGTHMKVKVCNKVLNKVCSNNNGRYHLSSTY